MSLNSKVLYPETPKIQRTPELNIILFLLLLLLCVSIFFSYNNLLFLTCICFAFILSLRHFLPSHIRSLSISSHLPQTLQNGLWSSHTVELSFELKHHKLPLLFYKDITNEDESVGIQSSVQYCKPNKKRNSFQIRTRILPLSQGHLIISGFKLYSYSGLGLFKWSVYVPHHQKRIVHTKNININTFELNHQIASIYDKDQLLNSEKMNGESIGWPREYQFGDPISRIDWKRISHNPLKPIVFTSLLPEPPQTTIIVDTFLRKKIVGDSQRLIKLTEFTKAICLILLKNGQEVDIHILSETYHNFHLEHPDEFRAFLNNLACTNLTNSNDAQNELSKHMGFQNKHIIHLLMDSEINNYIIPGSLQLSLNDLIPLEENE